MHPAVIDNLNMCVKSPLPFPQPFAVKAKATGAIMHPNSLLTIWCITLANSLCGTALYIELK